MAQVYVNSKRFGIELIIYCSTFGHAGDRAHERIRDSRVDSEWMVQRIKTLLEVNSKLLRTINGFTNESFVIYDKPQGMSYAIMRSDEYLTIKTVYNGLIRVGKQQRIVEIESFEKFETYFFPGTVKGSGVCA